MKNQSQKVDSTLATRENNYGSFTDNADISQQLKDVIRSGKSYDKLSNTQKEVLEMICTKISRIMGGDPSYLDTWHDISGYAKLAEEELGAERKT